MRGKSNREKTGDKKEESQVNNARGLGLHAQPFD